MRTLFGCLAALLCLVSVALTARYGYKGADTETDGVISAVVFGLIALCACLFNAAAVRLWFMKHQAGSVMIGLIATAALIVTFTNSFGRHCQPCRQHPGRTRTGQGRPSRRPRRTRQDQTRAGWAELYANDGR